MPALPSSAAMMPPAAPTPTMTTSVFCVAMADLLPKTLTVRTRVRSDARCSRASQQRSRIFPVAVDDRIRAHEGERLDGQRRIEARLRRKRRAADHEQIGNIPA